MWQEDWSAEHFWAIFGIVVGLFAVIVAIYRPINKTKTVAISQAKFDASDPEVIIIGGGLAGASLASILGAEGRRVVVIERDMSPPDTIRGETLTAGGVLALQALGLKHLMDTFSCTRINGYTYYDKAIDVRVSLPLPRVCAYALRHGVFVNVLRKHAMTQKSVTFIEAIGKDLVRENGRVVGVTYREKGAEECKRLRAPLTVVCDGYYSTLRKQFSSLPTASSLSSFIGIELDNVSLPQGRNWVEFVSGLDNIPALSSFFYYSIGSDAYRFMVQVKGEPPMDRVSFLRDTIAPLTPDYIRKSLLETLSAKPETKCVRIKVCSGDLDSIPLGMLILGDAFNTRDPIAGTGMTVALKDILYWRDTLRGMDLSDDETMMQKRIQFKEARHSWAWSISTAAHVLSAFTSNKDYATCRMRQQFFRALKYVEDGTENEIRSVMDVLYSVNTDPATLKYMLETTRKDTIMHAFYSRPWTGVFCALQEAIAVYFKFNEICGPAFKTCKQ